MELHHFNVSRETFNEYYHTLIFLGFRWTDWLPSHLWQTELVVPHYFFILPYFVINVNTLLIYLK